VYGQYYPKYECFYMDEPSDSGGYDIYLKVRQTQATQPTVFQMPVDFFFNYAGMPDDTVTLVVDERSELFKVNQPSEVDTIRLDPAGWILKDVTYPAWQMFIITLDYELGNGMVGSEYVDTIETRGGTGPNTVSLASGVLPPGLSINNAGVISGAPTEAGLFEFRVTFINTATGFSDQRLFDIEISGPPCCTGKVGNVNGLNGDEPTISDISTLIDMLYISGNEPACLLEADVNQSGSTAPVRGDITISDVSILIDHLFITGVELLDCL